MNNPRPQAAEFPMMIVISVAYPCNFGCPNCPYSDGNSELRKFYHDAKGDFIPFYLWAKITEEAGPYGSWLRMTGGGEPMLHPGFMPMVNIAKGRGCKIWLNTNGSKMTPIAARQLLTYGVDLIEFSMDSAESESYAKLRPPLYGPPKDEEAWFYLKVDAIRDMIAMRNDMNAPTKIVVSMIRQKEIADKIDAYVRRWKDFGVDEVITRKFLSWDNNTHIDLENAADENLYRNLSDRCPPPCVWPFERLNIDTLGRVALCGQDISFTTSPRFPNLRNTSIYDIWHGTTFRRYREAHLAGAGASLSPCKDCSAWFAGIRDPDYGWLQVLEKAEGAIT